MKLSDFFKNSRLKWVSVIVVSILAIFLYTFMEWIFIVTKPSFMSSMKLTESFSIFFSTAAFGSGLYAVAIIPFALLSQKLSERLRNIAIFLAILIPGFIIGCLALLTFDNFTYTVFQTGIVTSRGFIRGLYGIFLLVIIYLSTSEVLKIIQKADNLEKKINKKQKRIILIVLSSIIVLAGFLPVILNLVNNPPNQFVNSLEPGQISKKPHIFLITLEGMNADHMSMYGYERATTPFLEEFAESSLVGLNGFTNSANTTGSIISLLSSRYPIDNNVLYPPDILQSEDAYQHLPAILKMNGYTTAQYSFGHYVDAYQLNVKNGFDTANGRSYKSNILNKLKQWLPNNLGYFIYESGNRIYDRILHVFFIKLMPNPIKEVSFPTNFDDADKVESILDLLDSSESPIFVHLHWMGTHGAKFSPATQVFSAGKDEVTQAPWDQDFYDDSILDFDQSLESFYEELSRRGVAENSIFIIVSDHGQKWVANKRLPFLIRFPDGEFHQTIEENVQNLDIAPTVLDYLGITIPKWMAGSSLLEQIPNDRPIFALGVGTTMEGDNEVMVHKKEPPFYQFGYVSMAVCDTLYEIDLIQLSLQQEVIEGYIGECSASITQEQAIQMFIAFFETYGFDASSLKDIDILN